MCKAQCLGPQVVYDQKEDMTGVYIVKMDVEMSASKEAHTKY